MQTKVDYVIIYMREAATEIIKKKLMGRIIKVTLQPYIILSVLYVGGNCDYNKILSFDDVKLYGKKETSSVV